MLQQNCMKATEPDLFAESVWRGNLTADHHYVILQQK